MELITDFEKALDYLEVMNRDIGNITLNYFILKMRKKYKLKSELKMTENKALGKEEER